MSSGTHSQHHMAAQRHTDGTRIKVKAEYNAPGQGLLVPGSKGIVVESEYSQTRKMYIYALKIVDTDANIGGRFIGIPEVVIEPDLDA